MTGPDRQERVNCGWCNGTGIDPNRDDGRDCPRCHGGTTLPDPNRQEQCPVHGQPQTSLYECTCSERRGVRYMDVGGGASLPVPERVRGRQRAVEGRWMISKTVGTNGAAVDAIDGPLTGAVEVMRIIDHEHERNKLREALRLEQVKLNAMVASERDAVERVEGLREALREIEEVQWPPGPWWGDAEGRAWCAAQKVVAIAYAVLDRQQPVSTEEAKPHD